MEHMDYLFFLDKKIIIKIINMYHHCIYYHNFIQIGTDTDVDEETKYKSNGLFFHET